MTDPRYTIVRHYHDRTETVGVSNKRRTAHRLCFEHEAGNLSHVAFYTVVNRAGAEVRPNGSTERRELHRAQWRAFTQTVAFRGVW